MMTEDGDLPLPQGSESARYPSGGEMPPGLLPATDEEAVCPKPSCHGLAISECLPGIATECDGGPELLASRS